MTQKQVDASYHKNISYRPLEDRLKGVDQDDPAQRARVHEIMRGYSRQAIAFMSTLLKQIRRDLEDRLRQLPADRGIGAPGLAAFAERPAAFRLVPDAALARRPACCGSSPTSIRSGRGSGSPPTTSRRWPASSPSGSGCIASRGRWRPGKHLTVRAAARLGLPVVDRPPYDRFMLKIHHAMKEDAGFQQTCRKDRWEFPAGSTWIVFTDSASHACLSGQYMLEQTFIVRRSSLACPEKAPIAILEKLAGHPLARSA